MEGVLVCVIKAALLTCRGAWGMAGGAPQIMPCPWSCQPICTSPEGHWDQQQAGRQVQDAEKGHPVQACPQRASALLARCEAHQEQPALEHLLDWGSTQRGEGHSGRQGRSISELCESCYGMSRWGSAAWQRGRLREEQVWEEQQDIGSEGLLVCKWNMCLAVPLSLHSILYRCVQSKMRLWELHGVCVFVLLECHLVASLCRRSAKKPGVLTLGLSRVQ